MGEECFDPRVAFAFLGGGGELGDLFIPLLLLLVLSLTFSFFLLLHLLRLHRGQVGDERERGVALGEAFGQDRVRAWTLRAVSGESRRLSKVIRGVREPAHGEERLGAPEPCLVPTRAGRDARVRGEERVRGSTRGEERGGPVALKRRGVNAVFVLGRIEHGRRRREATGGGDEIPARVRLRGVGLGVGPRVVRGGIEGLLELGRREHPGRRGIAGEILLLLLRRIEVRAGQKVARARQVGEDLILRDWFLVAIGERTPATLPAVHGVWCAVCARWAGVSGCIHTR